MARLAADEVRRGLGDQHATRTSSGGRAAARSRRCSPPCPTQYGIVQAFWRSFVPRPDDGALFAERMTARLSQHAPINDPTSFYRPVDQGRAPRGSECHRRAAETTRWRTARFSTADHLAPDRGPALSAALARAVDAQGRAPGRSVHEAHRALGHGLSPEGLRRAPERSDRASSTQSLVVDDAAVAARRGRGHAGRRHPPSRRTATCGATRLAASRCRRSASSRSCFRGRRSQTTPRTRSRPPPFSEAYAVRAQRQLDGIEQRLHSLEER